MIATYIPFLRRDASVALLALMMALKCLELRTLRDATVVICLGYFLIITNFLYSQTIPTALFMAVVMGWLTATMVSLQDHRGSAGARARGAHRGAAHAPGGAADAGAVPVLSARSGPGVRLAAGHLQPASPA